jgi:hypothetical protein
MKREKIIRFVALILAVLMVIAMLPSVIGMFI